MARMAVIVGAEAQTVAVAWQVYSITHRALDLGYTGLALFLPGLFFLLPAGHVADRYDRRQIILLCYALQIVCTGALLAIAVMGVRDVRLIYAVLFVIGTVQASGFASWDHVRTILITSSFIGLVGVGQTLCMLTGGIDLSIPANLAGAAVLTAFLANGSSASLLWLDWLLFFIILPADCVMRYDRGLRGDESPVGFLEWVYVWLKGKLSRE